MVQHNQKLSTELASALDKAESEAGKLRDEYISAEHLLLPLLELSEIKPVLELNRKDVLESLAKCEDPREWLVAIQKAPTNHSKSTLSISPPSHAKENWSRHWQKEEIRRVTQFYLAEQKK